MKNEMGCVFFFLSVLFHILHFSGVYRRVYDLFFFFSIKPFIEIYCVSLNAAPF